MGDRGPERDRRDAGPHARVLQDAEDPGRVPRTGCAPGPHRSADARSYDEPVTGVGRVCGVSDSSAPSSTTRSARRTRGHVEEFLGEPAPAHVGLDSAHEHHVVVGAGWPAHREPGGRPLDPPGHAVDQRDRRPVDLEVVVVVRVDRGQRPGVPDQLEVLHAGGGAVAGVVPPLEARRPARGGQLRPVLELGHAAKPTTDRCRVAGPALDLWTSDVPVDDVRGRSRRPGTLFDHVPERRVRPADHPARATRGRRRRDGHDAPGRRPHPRRLRGSRGLQRDPQRHPARRGRAASTTPISRSGCDAVETNTFGANFANLAEYDIADRIGELAEAGARLGPRGRRRLLHAGPAALGDRLGRARAPSCPPSATRRTRRCATRTRRRSPACSPAAPTRCWWRPAQDLLQAKSAIIGAPAGDGGRRRAACR